MISKRKDLYKKRQDIVEHPFGTLKRQWGYDHTLMKTIPKVITEFSIITLCYNIRRVISIMGVNELILAIKEVFAFILSLSDLIAKLTEEIIILTPKQSPCITCLKIQGSGG